MESLYTKYRPQTFADVVGQSHVVTTLEHAVLEGRTSHAYLFCGPRGTGKTTMARLLAKALMCEQGEGHLPDGTCEQCRLIAAGEHPDVYELDAASRTGVDNVRDEIISRVSFAPVRAPYKMYIIDEVHMLTTAAFNALLKTLEEPPAHVVFVLCTTDPQKIPETILSRVQRFDFHSISNADIQARLAYICDREGFSYDPEALELVVRHARGGMRDAISELEQLSVSGGGSITVDVARDVLGEVSASTLERMSLAMANRDVPALFAQVNSLVEVGRDLLQFTRALAGRLRDVYVVAAIGASSGTVQASDDELPAISREAKAFGSVDRISRALGLLSDASTEMRVAPNQRLVLEVALTKIARPQSELTLEALADRVSSLERQIVALSVPSARSAAPAPASTGQSKKSAKKEAPAEPAPAKPKAEPAPQILESHAAKAAPVTEPVRAATPRPEAPATSVQPAAQAPVVHAQTRPQAQPNKQVSAAAAQKRSQSQPMVQEPAIEQTAPATPPVSDKGELQRKWKQVVDGLLASHPQHGSLLMSSSIVSDDGQTLVISFPKGSTFACKMLERADVKANVDPAIEAVFGHRKTSYGEGNARAQRAASPASSTSRPKQQQPTSTTAPTQTRPTPQAPVQSAPVQQAPVRQAPVQPQPNPAPWQASVSQQPQAPASRQAPAPQQPPAPRQAPASQQAYAPQQPAYQAPWEPVQPDDDFVPYDDFDAAPYEEDYAFGQIDPQRAVNPYPATAQQPAAPRQQYVSGAGRAPRQSQPVTSPSLTSTYAEVPATYAKPNPAPAVVSAPETVTTPTPVQAPATAPNPAQAPATAPNPAQAPATAPNPVQAPATASTPAQAPMQASTPAPASAPNPAQAPMQASTPAPASAPNTMPASASSAPAPAQTPVSETKPAPESAPAPKPTKAQDPAAASEEPPAARPKRKSRRAAGIPADIVSMMAEIFGEGVTYTAVVPDDEDDASLEIEPEEDPTESEYVDEAVDDADYEDEE